MKLEHLSASRIKTYEQCRLKYFAVYDLEKGEGDPHPLTVMGSAVHKAMEVSTKARVLGRRPYLFDPIQILPKYLAKLGVSPDLWDLARELVGNAIRWGYFRNIDKTEWCEIGFLLDIGGVKVKGFIDRLDLSADSADLVDMKTSQQEFTEEELKKNWQARIYNIAVRRLYPQVTGVVTVSFWVLRHRVQRVRLTAEDAERDVLELRLLAEEIRGVNGVPEGKPSGLCPWCPLYAECDWRKMGIKQRKIQTGS